MKDSILKWPTDLAKRLRIKLFIAISELSKDCQNPMYMALSTKVDWGLQSVVHRRPFLAEILLSHLWLISEVSKKNGCKFWNFHQIKIIIIIGSLTKWTASSPTATDHRRWEFLPSRLWLIGEGTLKLQFGHYPIPTGKPVIQHYTSTLPKLYKNYALKQQTRLCHDTISDRVLQTRPDIYPYLWGSVWNLFWLELSALGQPYLVHI